MIFSLAIYSSPSSQASQSAFEFASAILSEHSLEKHSIYRIFFYHEAVYHGSNITCAPQGEYDLNSSWQELQKNHNLDIVFCIAASLRRGIINQAEAERYGKPGCNLQESFELSGLGQLVDAAVVSDRLVTFGG